MLPRPASELDVTLSPGRLTWIRRERRWLRAIPAATSNRPVAASPDRPAWEPAIDVLAEVLQQERLPAGSIVNVVLSNHFVRYTLVPWNDLLTDAHERLAYAGRSFHAIYGDLVAGWDVRLSNDRYGTPAIASAMDKSLLDALARTTTAHGLRLGSVQPYFMTAFNRFRQQLVGRGAFVVVEPGRLVVGTHEPDRWRWIGSARSVAGSDLLGQVQQLLYQGQQWDITSIAVYSDTAWDDARTAASTLSVTHLFDAPSLSGLETLTAMGEGQ